MVIGSWAEFLYAYYFNSEFLPNIRTRDIDFLYPNIRKPAKPVQLERKMVEAGFTIARDTLTEVVKMFKEDLLEIEFITRQVGASGKGYLDIPGIAQSLDILIQPSADFHCNAVIIDQRILWYGSLAPLGFVHENDSIMRIESAKLSMDMESILIDNPNITKSTTPRG